MAITNERKLLLLGLLRRADMHGYMLNAHLDCESPISMKKPTAYNLLERMEKDGWIKHRDEPTGDRPRRVFTVTEAGECAFQDLLRKQLRAYALAELPGLVSLSFLDAIPASEALDLLKQRRMILEDHRCSLAKTGNAQNGSAVEGHARSAHISMEYTRRFLDFETNFLDGVIDSLE